MNDSDSGEDDTTRYFVNEKPPSFGRATHQRSQISCLVLGLAVEWAGRGAAGGGEGGTTALLGLPGEAVGSAARPGAGHPSSPRPPFKTNLTFKCSL